MYQIRIYKFKNTAFKKIHLKKNYNFLTLEAFFLHIIFILLLLIRNNSMDFFE